MRLLKYGLTATLALLSLGHVWSQDDDEDFSAYENLALTDTTPIKRFCTSKISAQTPNRLIAVGYDFFGPYKMPSAYTEEGLTAPGAMNTDFNFSHGLRAEATFPVVSTNKILFSLGGNYVEQRYSLKALPAGEVNPMHQTLSEGSIRNLSGIATLFKPLNERNFILAQLQGDYAGDWSLTQWHNPKFIKVSGAVIYGFKSENNRRMWGLGLTRTYRAGEVNYLPLFMFNYTNPSEKWGIEMLLPARADYRYNISKRNIIRAGLELEGSSYRLSDRNGHIASALVLQDTSAKVGDFNKLELRRSDIRLRAMWDFPIKDFYWLSVSVGYRLVYRYNVDQGEIYRSFGIVNDAPYKIYNDMGGAVFISVVATLVSP